MGSLFLRRAQLPFGPGNKQIMGFLPKKVRSPFGSEELLSGNTDDPESKPARPVDPNKTPHNDPALYQSVEARRKATAAGAVKPEDTLLSSNVATTPSSRRYG